MQLEEVMEAAEKCSAPFEVRDIIKQQQEENERLRDTMLKVSKVFEMMANHNKLFTDNTARYAFRKARDIITEALASGQILLNDFVFQILSLGSKVYRIERYNDENKIYEYTVNRMEQYLSGNEKQVVYSAHCKELEGFATENIMFFESAIGETVWLSYEEAQKELTI